jgi:HEAT repeat protein/tRNA A-37 threonylcarbamoyl transferase component Bud32
MRVCTSCRKLLKADANRCPVDGAAVEVVETLPKNTRLGAYKIDRVLGEGGMGFVYEATHEVLNRRTAIKMLRPELANHEQIVTRFLNEAKAVNLIDHQNIVNVYDYGDNHDGSVYFVMEFLEGETLDDLMRKWQRMALPLLLHLFGQIAKALAAAHGKQIVHRDLKPANVYIIAREDNPYFIKLLDFGIAQLRGAGAVQGLTLVGSVMGTPQYMSPEQISGGTVDARSDVWAMGVMMYRAATGQAPFKGEELGELADKILHHPPPPASELVAMPASLSALIMRCLERRLEDRCPSIAELIAGLERVKRECKLDDDAILVAVKADAGTILGGAPSALGQRTRESLAGSVPRHQGAANLALRPGVPAATRSGVAKYLAIGAIVAGLGGAGYLVLGRGKATAGQAVPGHVEVSTPTLTVTIKDRIAEGQVAEARALAMEVLGKAIHTGQQQEQGFAVDALGLARATATAPLLYDALKLEPAVRVKAAHALVELALPDAAPKLRSALAVSSETVKVELAAALYRLGDKNARAILVRALDDAGLRQLAAIAMAEVGDDASRAVLAEVVATIPAGREQWRSAAGGLVKLGDAAARKLLEGELAQADAARAVGAADLLARAGHARAREQLARVVADKDFPRRGEAAVALAGIDDGRALGWVDDGLASTDTDERTRALQVCGRLAEGAARYAKQIAAAATEEKDLQVRLTATAVLLSVTKDIR